MTKSYLEQMKEIEKLVELEIPAFKVLTPKRKVQVVAMILKNNCERRNSANRYKKLETKNPKYKTLREENEYYELLSSTRLLKKIPILDENELGLYVLHLKNKLEETLIERDIKKRFFMYDYITTGCRVCNVENEKIMQELAELKEKSKQIIQDIPTM